MPVPLSLSYVNCQPCANICAIIEGCRSIWPAHTIICHEWPYICPVCDGSRLNGLLIAGEMPTARVFSAEEQSSAEACATMATRTLEIWGWHHRITDIWFGSNQPEFPRIQDGAAEFLTVCGGRFRSASTSPNRILGSQVSRGNVRENF